MGIRSNCHIFHLEARIPTRKVGVFASYYEAAGMGEIGVAAYRRT